MKYFQGFIKILVITLSLVGCTPYQEVIHFPGASALAVHPDSFNVSNKIEKLIAPYKVTLDVQMNEIIGFSPTFLMKQKPSSALGSFMCDAVLEQAKKLFPEAELCLLNYGGIRSTLDSGEITVGEIFQLMPFDNSVVLLTISQKVLDELKSFIVAKGGEPLSHSWLNLPEKSRYYLVVNDYMANGGDNYSVLKEASERKDSKLLIRDALLNYIKTHKILPIDFSNRSL